MSEKKVSYYIHGQWVHAESEEWTPDVNPSDATHTLALLPAGDPAIVDRVVEGACEAAMIWKKTAGPARAEVLHRVANALAARRQELGLLVALEVGKPIGEALQEVDRGVMILRYFAEEAVRPLGQVIPAQVAGSLQYSMRQPLGPIAVITPWNFPVAIPLWKMAPALAYGNTIVWKPAEIASLVAISLVEAFEQGGLPAGVLNLVLGKGSRIGDKLIQHPDIRAITFTGSEQTGMEIAAKAARRNLKYQLEMGGKNAALVLADADLDQAAKLVAAGAMRFAGQKCTATSRLIVMEEVRDAFLERLITQIKALPIAPASEMQSAVGPLSTREAQEKVRSYAEAGARSGNVLLGGHEFSSDTCKNGFFFEPTVIADLPNDSSVVQEEVFGPLLTVQVAKSFEEVISLANSTRFGLSVALFTRDINAILSYVQDIESGMVRVNGDTTGVDPHAPFGGLHHSSSHSREQGPAAVEFFTDMKTVQINPAG